ncbi:hypothetical protein HanIR_Chr15g0759021 [Helianthus annuus]|nr:hypothetical protein HanIR_Chr15g0759021 [Helianthus annuus]
MVKVLSGTEGLPKSWEKIMAAAKVYAQTEKNLTTNRPPPPHSRPTDLSATGERRFKKSWRESSGSRSSEDARATINKLSAQRDNKHENRERQWTPLTKTPAEVLSTEDYQFKPPILMKSKRGQDLAQYCEYHKDTGHHKQLHFLAHRDRKSPQKWGVYASTPEYAQGDKANHPGRRNLQQTGKDLRDSAEFPAGKNVKDGKTKLSSI